MAESAYTLPIGDGLSRGEDPNGTPKVLPVGGTVFKTTTPLAANGIITTGWINTAGYGALLYVLRADTNSTPNGIAVEYSDNAITPLPGGAALSYTQINQQIQRALVPKGQYTRLTFTNGGTAQVNFRMEVKLSTTLVQPTEGSMNVPITDSALGMYTVSDIQATDGTANGYDRIHRTGTSLNVHVDNATADTDVSALATSTNQTNGNQKAQVTNFPASQAVTNTALGNAGDTAITDPTLSASVVALLKGLVAESIAQATTGTATDVTLAANVAQTIPANANGKGRIVSSSSGTTLIGVGFTPTATRWTYRIVPNGTAEISPHWATLPIGLLSTASSTVTVTTLA